MTLDDAEFFREIGHRLRVRRDALGWTQAQLAWRCETRMPEAGRPPKRCQLLPSTAIKLFQALPPSRRGNSGRGAFAPSHPGSQARGARTPRTRGLSTI